MLSSEETLEITMKKYSRTKMLSRNDNMFIKQCKCTELRELCPERERNETVRITDRGAIHFLLSMKHATLKGNVHTATGMEKRDI